MMTSGVVLAVALLAVGAFGFLTIAVTRRQDRRGVSRETRKADRRQAHFLNVEPQQRGAAYEARSMRLAAASRSTPATEPVLVPVSQLEPDPQTIGVTRRQFFNRSVTAMMGLGLSGFGAAVLAFLWPAPSGGFGSKITVGGVEDLLSSIRDTREPHYVAAGRFYITPYPQDALPKAETTYSASVLPGMRAGVVALYQKCPHLGCRVPFCSTSQWFECGCHGSQYNRVGEKKAGPAPRGMDQFPIEVNGGSATVDTGLLIQGQAIGTNTTGQEAEGPHCVGAGH
jgi:cytochrome b6-f complex iron-sulfur subunit